MTEISRASTDPSSGEAQRLPGGIRPTRYVLCLEPDIEAATFSGSETVHLQVDHPSREIVCNAADLNITHAGLVAPSGEVVACSVEHEEATERLRIIPEGDLHPGAWQLSLRWTAKLNDKLRGFYRSEFVDQDGNRSALATTQFEATDARRAFPCWDEPDAKAVFEVTLVAPNGCDAVSNSSEVSRRLLEDARTEIRFAETIKMSTYLLAFIVGPIRRSPSISVAGVEISVVHVPGKEGLGDFALQAAAHALEFFGEWFGVPYPGAKLDLIAIPDFAFGAMENFGAVTFRESALLVNPSEASRAELERIATVVAHEIAHMWFGDMVTMKWWNGLWLNEAFATFMELLCTDHFRPEWEVWGGFALLRDDAMTVDSLHSTRSIEYPVATPQDAEGMFDRLTYEKGGAVLRMLEQYLGAERFRDGIRHYISSFLYRNADTTDLWDSIEAVVGEPVRAMMDSWIFQGGHPMVEAALSDGQTLELSQRRFLYGSPGDQESSDPGKIWHVPLRISPGDASAERRLLFSSASQSITLEPGETIRTLNASGTGVFRTRFSSGLDQEVLGAINTMGEAERFSAVADAWALAVSGGAALEEWVALVRALEPAPDPNLWASVASSISLLYHVAPTDTLGAVASFTRELLRPVLDLIGWEPSDGERPLVPTLRARLIAALGTIGEDADVEAWTLERFTESFAGWRLSPDLIRSVLSCVAHHGGEPEYEVFSARIKSAKTPQEELRYLFNLASFPSPSLLDRTLEAALTEIRSQNGPFVIGQALSSRRHGRSAWAFAERQWSEMEGRFPSMGLGRALQGLEAQGDAELARAVRAFVSQHPIPSAERTVALALERMEAQAAFADREANRLEGLLARP